MMLVHCYIAVLLESGPHSDDDRAWHSILQPGAQTQDKGQEGFTATGVMQQWERP